MESLVRYVLKSVFEEYLTGFDGDMDTTRSSVTLCDLSLREQKVQDIRKGNTSALQLEGGTVGSLTFKALELGKVQVVANDVAFDFSFSPVAAGVRQYIAGQDAAAPGFVHRVQDLRSAGHWEALLGSGRAPQPIAPRYCGAHRRPERRRRGPVRMVECRFCKARLQTNYVACGLCPSCSGSEQRCLVCGDPEVVALTVEEREAQRADVEADLAADPAADLAADVPIARAIKTTRSAPLPFKRKGVLPQTNDNDDPTLRDGGDMLGVVESLLAEEGTHLFGDIAVSRRATAIKKVPGARGDDCCFSSPREGLSSPSSTRLSSNEALSTFSSMASGGRTTPDAWAARPQPSVQHPAPPPPPTPLARLGSFDSCLEGIFPEESTIARPCTSRAVAGGVTWEKPPEASSPDASAQRWETLSETGSTDHNLPVPPPELRRRPSAASEPPLTPPQSRIEGPELSTQRRELTPPQPEPPAATAGGGRTGPVTALMHAFSSTSFQ